MTPMDSVSKEAREAAAESWPTTSRYADEIRAGKHDGIRKVQAFARFQEATRLAVVEECAVLCDVAAGRAREAAIHATTSEMSSRNEKSCAQYEATAAAIRALQPKVAGQ